MPTWKDRKKGDFQVAGGKIIFHCFGGMEEEGSEMDKLKKL